MTWLTDPRHLLCGGHYRDTRHREVTFLRSKAVRGWPGFGPKQPSFRTQALRVTASHAGREPPAGRQVPSRPPLHKDEWPSRQAERALWPCDSQKNRGSNTGSCSFSNYQSLQISQANSGQATSPEPPPGLCRTCSGTAANSTRERHPWTMARKCSAQSRGQSGNLMFLLIWLIL